MLYINKDAKGFYVQLDTELDVNSNYVGTTWEDYTKGAWILLSAEQTTFKELNPDASVKEVFDMELVVVESIEPSELDVAKANKLAEITEQDEESNKFRIKVVQADGTSAMYELWIDKDLRNSLYSITLPSLKAQGVTTTKLWANTTPPISIEVPVDWTLEHLPELEVYAKQTYDIMAENVNAVYDAYNEGSVEAINSIDVAANYPSILTFTLELCAEE